MNYKTSKVSVVDKHLGKDKSKSQRDFQKCIVISSLRDIELLSKQIEIVHFRKYISKPLILEVLKRCPKIRKISLSKYAFDRVDGALRLVPNEIKIMVSEQKGRPSILEKILLYA